MLKLKFIKRTYRITTNQEKLVKKNKKKYGSSSEFIRQAIENEAKIALWKTPSPSSS